MAAYVIRRIGASVLSIVVIISGVFLAIRLIPGDPVDILLGEYWTPEAAEALRRELGLDKPLAVQYVRYVSQVLSGELGDSYRTGRPVLEDLLEQYPHTVRLALASLLLSVAMGVPLGVISAVRRNSLTDLASMSGSLLWLSIPSFWFGLLLLLVFSVNLRLFPVIGAGDARSLISTAHHLVLPAVALGARDAALLARMTRSAMLDISDEDYIRTARAKGLRERVVIYRHALRNAMIPVLSITGMNAIALLGGAVVTETVFSRPGLGTLLVIGVSQRDYPQIIGVLYFFVTAVVVINFMTDLCYAAVDPRLRLARGRVS